MVDGHVHPLRVGDGDHLLGILDAVNACQAGLACQDEDSATNNNPVGFLLKKKAPKRCYLLAGLEHSGILFPSRSSLLPAKQAERLFAAGADGFKLLAAKPTMRKKLGLPLNSSYFRGFFDFCAHHGIPLLCHVADPEGFWDPAGLPDWARAQGWGYDSSFPSKEALYEEMEEVLVRHTGLRVVLPHFYFLSDDLERAARLLDRFPGVFLDLAPGIELYYNLSRNIVSSKRFFLEYAERILYGTDILSAHSKGEACKRAGLVCRFLIGSETFRIPDGADFLLGPSADGLIEGLSLPQESLKKIFQENFHRLFGSYPRPLNEALAREECGRLAQIEAEVSGLPVEETEAAMALLNMNST